MAEHILPPKLLEKLVYPVINNPLNIGLTLILLYVLLPLLLPHPDTVVWTRYTPRTLAVYDGSGNPGEEGSRILLAISGKVFDVTKGGNFYGPGGPYGNFAGRDASRGMAKQSFDLNMLTPLDQPLDKLEDLTPMEISNMREWEGHFTAKYGIVGELVNEADL